MKFDITVTYKQLQFTRYFREVTAILHFYPYLLHWFIYLKFGIGSFRVSSLSSYKFRKIWCTQNHTLIMSVNINIICPSFVLFPSDLYKIRFRKFQQKLNDRMCVCPKEIGAVEPCIEFGSKRVSINVNKNPTRCKSMHIFIYCKVTLHVSGVTAPIIRSTKNCNRNLRYRS